MSLSNDGLDFTFPKNFRPVCRSWFSPVLIENYALRLIESSLNCTAVFSLGEGDGTYHQVPVQLIFNSSHLLLSDYFTVECSDLSQHNSSTIKRHFYPKLPYASIHYNRRVRERLKKVNQNKEDYNILILGLDSISRLQFERMLPQTFHYITKELHGIVLQGLFWKERSGDESLP